MGAVARLGSRFSGEGGKKQVGSRFRGNDAAAWGARGQGALRPSWRLRADWIPAYAGMTVGW